MVTVTLLIGGISCYLLYRPKCKMAFWDRYGFFIMGVMFCGLVEYNYHYNPHLLYERATLLEARGKRSEAIRILTQLAEEDHYAKAEAKLTAFASTPK